MDILIEIKEFMKDLFRMKQVGANETENQRIGRIGENVACTFLMKRGFKIVERNHWRKWGEIDIVAKKQGRLYFVEVKTTAFPGIRSVSPETLDGYQPEEKVHPQKLKRMSRVIQTYLLEKKYEGEWQFDVLVVFLDEKRREAKCRYIENVVL
ncbi:MAG: YraN family protein [Candidatus Pacebacteria bacterium]|nr:YraN family protein [Candidatus Paceibacterota bacterium]